MTKIRLTDRWISSARPPREGRVSVVDGLCPGLHLRITRHGTKSFSVLLRRGSKLVRQTLGEYPQLTLAAARREAVRLQREAASCESSVTLASPLPAGEGIAFADLVESFVDLHLKPNTKSWKNVQSTLRQEALTSFAQRPAAAIGKQDVVAALDRMVARSVPHAASNLLKALHAMYNWAVARGDVPTNPLLGVRAPVRTTQRERILTDAEIVAILKACDDVPRPFGDLVRFLLHTGLRRAEASEMKWSELVGNVFTLPAARSKSGRPNELPLPPAVMAIINEQRRFSDGKGYVFTTTGGARPSSDFSKRKQRLDAASGTSGWRLHDARRTARSKYAELGVPPEVARRIVGHSVDQLDATYDRFNYAEPKAKALQALADHLAELMRSHTG